MKYKNIKCVITDFDKTLYSESDLSGVNEYYSKFFYDKKLMKKSQIKVKSILKDYPGFHMVQCIYKIARENGIRDEEVQQWFDEHIYDITCDGMRVVKPAIMKKLCETLPVYILSDSEQGHLNKYIKMFGYEKSWFAGCISNRFDSENMSKSIHMIEIMNELNLSKDEVIMIGDSMRSDILAAERVGILWEHVLNVDDTERVFNEIINSK